MRTAQPYIYIEDCKENMKFYADVFKGRLQNIQYGDENGKPLENGGFILHAELVVGDQLIHFSDMFQPMKHGNHIQIVLKFDSENEIHTVYERLVKGGVEKMPLTETFWNAIHGHLVDKNGISWVLDYQKV